MLKAPSELQRSRSDVSLETFHFHICLAVFGRSSGEAATEECVCVCVYTRVVVSVVAEKGEMIKVNFSNLRIQVFTTCLLCIYKINVCLHAFICEDYTEQCRIRIIFSQFSVTLLFLLYPCFACYPSVNMEECNFPPEGNSIGHSRAAVHLFG